MKVSLFALLAGLMIMTSGCGEQPAGKNGGGDSPAFMFWCFRKEVVTDEYHVPEMSTPSIATYIQSRLRTIPGFESSRCDLERRTLSISYRSSLVRKMNFEEAIALSGFSANGRPADPTAKIPEGVQ